MIINCSFILHITSSHDSSPIKQIFKNLADCLKDVAKDDRTGTKGEVMGMHAVQKWFQKLYVEAEKQAGNPGFQ